MAETNKVQLKREEVVGNETVLSDIYPMTDTVSVEDSSRGITLNQTLDRIFNDINDKISRQVNSVNGRTGVVVINAEDVGLGNVTNVSFTDIKQWVLDQLKKGFNDHRLRLFENLEDATEFMNNHGEEHDGTPFYCDHGFMNDELSYKEYKATIGVFIYDHNLNRLAMVNKEINTIGKTDNSIIYDEQTSTKDYRGGQLGVNIWKYEDALKIMNGINKDESGLYIDKSKIVANVYYYDGMYGNGQPDDADAFLYYDLTGVDPSTLHPVEIRINGKSSSQKSSRHGPGILPLYLKQSISLNDIIITNFSDERYYDPNTFPSSEAGKICKGLYEGMVDDLTMNQFSIGKVTQAPDEQHPNRSYIIDFYTMKPNVGHGLKLFTTNDQSKISVNSNMIGIDLIESKMSREKDSSHTFQDIKLNMSGINAFTYQDIPTRTQTYESSTGVERRYNVILPSGMTENVFDNDTAKGTESNGLHISTNYSLCLIPRNAFDPINDHDQYNKANYIANWPIMAPPIPYDRENPLSDETLIGINLEKYINNDTPIKAVKNLSGLRINTESGGLTEKWLGYSDDDTTTVYPEGDHSGGLSVNVGDFLGIGMDSNTSTKYGDDYYKDGKVNVRIKEDGGLRDGGENDLEVALYKSRVTPDRIDNGIAHGGLKFSYPGTGQLDDTKGISVARGLGLRMSKYRSNGNTDTYYENIGISLFDPGYADDDIDPSVLHNQKRRMYGGLRYLRGDASEGVMSSIAIRVNNTNASVDDTGGTLIKKGTKGLCIDNDNVLGVQLKDGGGLTIDEDGCLIVNGGGGGGGTPDIELGPGLIWG